MTLHWIRQKQKTTPTWRMRERKEYCTEWPRSTTCWTCGRAAKTYVLHRRNLALKISIWQQRDTFRTQKISSKHPGHSFNMMVRLHWNCQKDHLCYQLGLQRTSLEDELKYYITTKSGESTFIQSKVMRMVHLNAFRTPKIGLARMATWIIQISGKTIVWPLLNRT